MNINNVSHSMTRPMMNATGRRTAGKTENDFTKSVDKAHTAGVPTAESDMDAFKKSIYDEINALKSNPSVSFSINITDGGFERMKNDPAYKDAVMGRIREEFAAARPPVTSSITTVDENGYSGWAFLNGNGMDKFDDHAEKSSYKRPAETSPKSKEKTESSDAKYRDWLNKQMMMRSADNRKVLQQIIEDARLEKENVTQQHQYGVGVERILL
jgi:hypothetical protein